MNPEVEAGPETDPGFPSGKWIGFYTYQGPLQYRMDLFLQFKGTRLSGDGVDNIGRFVIEGTYSCETRLCTWLKQYIGQHRVHYFGLQRGKVIAGEWTLRGGSGGFRIWPASESALTAEYFVEEKTQLSVIPPERALMPYNPVRVDRLKGRRGGTE